MKKLLVTIATENILPYAKEIIENQRWYAGKQKYDYLCHETIYWPNLHPSFSKVWEIWNALETGYERIIWADADVAFMDSSFDLATLLDDTSKYPDGYFMAAYQQTNWKTWRYLCNGLIVLRNDDECKKYVAEWMRRVDTHFIKDHPWEQWYFDEIIRETDWHRVRCCTGAEIGCFAPETWHDGTIWKRGYPTVHFAGSHISWPERQRAFLEHYLPQVK